MNSSNDENKLTLVSSGLLVMLAGTILLCLPLLLLLSLPSEGLRDDDAGQEHNTGSTNSLCS